MHKQDVDEKLSISNKDWKELIKVHASQKEAV